MFVYLGFVPKVYFGASFLNFYRGFVPRVLLVLGFVPKVLF